MKIPLKSLRIVLSLALLAAFAFSGCETTGDGAASSTHEMGPPRNPYRMSDRSMTGYH